MDFLTWLIDWKRIQVICNWNRNKLHCTIPVYVVFRLRIKRLACLLFKLPDNIYRLILHGHELSMCKWAQSALATDACIHHTIVCHRNIRNWHMDHGHSDTRTLCVVCLPYLLFLAYHYEHISTAASSHSHNCDFALWIEQRFNEFSQLQLISYLLHRRPPTPRIGQVKCEYFGCLTVFEWKWEFRGIIKINVKISLWSKHIVYSEIWMNS